MTLARVFVHPRCWDGPAFGTLKVTLEERGFDVHKIRIGPSNQRNYRELVRLIGENDATATYARMDGSQFTHRLGGVAPEPEAA